jgi:hypothetical protein
MTIDITRCNKVNIIDSCSIWNLLSSLTLFNRLESNNFHFSITRYVEYECLYKQRTEITKEDTEIQDRLVKHRNKGKFLTHNLTIDDLQDEAIVNNSRKLGIGELSTIAFCKKIAQTFLTDDQGARKIGQRVLGHNNVQTVPHLFGWLFYEGDLIDSDLELIIFEHNNFIRPLEKYFRQVYDEALRLRCLFPPISK